MSHKVYMLQDDLGNYVTIDEFEREHKSCLGGEWYESYEIAKEDAEMYSLHVVTLTINDPAVSLPEPVAKFVHTNKGTAAFNLLYEAYNNYALDNIHDTLRTWLFANSYGTTDERVKLLMKLLDANDHTKIVVAGPTKYHIPLTGLRTSDGEKQYLSYKDGDWFASREDTNLQQEFTSKQLEKAPKWIRGGSLKPEEVKYDE